MTFTSLRLTSAGHVPLFEGHVRRLGESSRDALRHFVSLAAEGVYRVWWDGRQLTTQHRAASQLRDGIGVRFAVSPYAAQSGRFAKPASPCPYDAVRAEGVVTLLTDASGDELLEADRAALVAWDGASLVLVPDEVPGVASVAEAEVLARLPHRRARILRRDGWPLLLINAVIGTCAPAECGSFPADQRAALEAVLR
ncbi:MAG: hypothetical protein ACOZQL_32335 [Myxococcota bacterium]